MKNEPAFPQPIDDMGTLRAVTCGLTIRDYFMVHAPIEEIEGIIPATAKGCGEWIGLPPETYNASDHYFLCVAKARRLWAQAMMKERAK